MSIFRTYDIRGIYPREINEEIAKNIGYYVTETFSSKKVLLCRDVRKGSDNLKNSLITGLKYFDKEVKIIDAGITSTPMFYYILRNYDFDFGIMITASHNTKEYCGMKLWKKEENLMPISYGTGEEIIEKKIKDDKKNIPDKEYEVLEKTYKKEYIDYLKDITNIDKTNIKLAIDYSNGSAIIYKEFLNAIADTIDINDNMDPDFPGHQPNPLLEESKKQCSKEILKNKADFGAIFDGDADRIVFLDERGRTIDTEKIISLIVQQMLQEKKSISSITTTINMSEDLNKFLQSKEIPYFRSRVGYIFVRQKAIDKNSIISAEKSTHFSYKEIGYTDSAIITLLYIMKHYSSHNMKFSELAQSTNIKKKAVESAFSVKEDDKEKILLKASDYYTGKAIKIEHIDGHTFYFDDYWFNIRKSNTMSEVKITLECNEDKREEIFNNIKKYLNLA